MSLSGIFLSHTALLGALATPGNTDQTGPTWAILPSTTDDVEADQQKYAVAVHLKQIGAGTARALVVTSHDGVTWCVAAASTLLSQAGQEVYEVMEPSRLLRHVAVVTLLTGNPKPNHVYAASLLSNGRFQLMRASKTVSLSLAVVNAAVELSNKSGRATVANGQSQKDVTFQVPWPNLAYTVVATPEDEAVACWVSNRTALGFRLNTASPVDCDTTVHWMAVHD